MPPRIPVSGKEWDWDYLLRVRKDVLDSWSTGRELQGSSGLDRAIDHHVRQVMEKPYKYAALRNLHAAETGRIQIVPAVGHALVDQTIAHIQQSEDLSPDRWYVLTDTYTRKGEYAKARDAVERSRQDSYSYLNGYPIVEHGVAGARAVNDATTAAVGTDNNDEDARLAWEIALAGGWTFGTIKSVEQVIQHSRDYPMESMIYNHQYMDRLAAYYTERGVPILRRASANLPGWDTLGFKVAISLIECLLAAAQGVKHIDLSIGIGMNLIQDVAAIQALRAAAHEFLGRSGFQDVSVHSWAYVFIGDWPMDPSQMAGQIAWNTAVCALGGCNGLFIKSPDEATTTPTGAGFRQGILMTGQVLRLISGQRLPESPDLALEREMIEAEMYGIVERVLDLGDGDLAVGACRAVDAGVIDTMFSPWRPLRGQVKLARDRQGALRYIEHGQVPLPATVVDYHRSKLAEREAVEGTVAGIDWVVREATWASRSLVDEIRDRGLW